MTHKNPFFYPSHPIIDEMIDDFFGNAFGNTKAVNKYPLTNVYITSDAAHLEIAIAGFSKDEIHIELEDGSLKIAGVKNVDKSEEVGEVRYIKNDIAKRNFEVSYSLMFDVDGIDAEIIDGILKIIVKPAEKEKETKHIEIK